MLGYHRGKLKGLRFSPGAGYLAVLEGGEVGVGLFDGFGVHLAFFSRTPAEIRMRILEGRRRAVEERREGLRAVLSRAGEQIDRYTRELHQLGLDTSEREVRWLNELIQQERAAHDGPAATDTGHDASTPHSVRGGRPAPDHRNETDENPGEQ